MPWGGKARDNFLPLQFFLRPSLLFPLSLSLYLSPSLRTFMKAIAVSSLIILRQKAMRQS
jgi:hypothetical protein